MHEDWYAQQTTSSTKSNHTRLMPSLLKVMTIHTCTGIGSKRKSVIRTLKETE